MARRERILAASSCLDRLETIYEIDGHEYPFKKSRLDRLIDLDVSRVDLKALLESDNEDFVHDMCGIFSNIVRNPDCPEKSYLSMFVPRCGLVA